jgi:hypothetical protein
MIPSLRAATVVGWKGSAAVTRRLGLLWPRTAVELSSSLPQQEIDESIDVLCAFSGLSLQTGYATKPNDTAFVYTTEDARAAVVRDSIAVRVVESEPNTPRRLSTDRVWWLLRDAVVECVRAEFVGTEVELCVGFATNVADTPVTALWFFDGVIDAWTHGQRDVDALCDAGIASVLRRMLGPGDEDLAQWVMAYALFGERADPWVDYEVRVRVDRGTALERAFERGWVARLGDGETRSELRMVFGAVAGMAQSGQTSRVRGIGERSGNVGVKRVLDRAADEREAKGERATREE